MWPGTRKGRKSYRLETTKALLFLGLKKGTEIMTPLQKRMQKSQKIMDFATKEGIEARQKTFHQQQMKKCDAEEGSAQIYPKMHPKDYNQLNFFVYKKARFF